MVFSSSVFLFLFFPLCLILYFIPVKNIKYKNAILLIFSIIFYLYGSSKYVLVLLISILINYLSGILIYKFKYKKTILVLNIIFNILLLSIFKIIGFNTESDGILPLIGPLGISFYTFQQISYIVDVYRKVVKAQTNIFKYALYVILFPQLIAGPIVRYLEIHNKLDKRKTTYKDFSDGTILFTIGLFKKCVIADSLGIYTKKILQDYANNILFSTSILLSWFSVILLVLQLYYDFSAYSDMAIGILKIFGFNNIEKNFNNPYRAISINDFWKRWNISLSKWFNDYILFPICNSKVYINTIKILSKIFNKNMAFKIGNFIVLLIIWILIGMWHGIGFNYLLFGLYYFIFIYLEKILKFPKKGNILSRIYTLIVVTVGTAIFFSYRDLDFTFLKSMFINKSFIDTKFLLVISSYIPILIISIIGILPITNFVKKIIRNKKIFNTILNISYVIMLFASIYFMILHSNVPFVYFNF